MALQGRVHLSSLRRSWVCVVSGPVRPATGLHLLKALGKLGSHERGQFQTTCLGVTQYAGTTQARKVNTAEVSSVKQETSAVNSQSIQNPEENVYIKQLPKEQEKIKNQQVENRVKKCPCLICGKSFHYNSGLRHHVRTHTNERPYVCTLCGKASKTKGDLKAHKRFHSNVKPFECDLCQARFASKSILKNHKLVHTNDKQFECDTCGAKFCVKGSLTRHVRRHTGIKPYKCSLCPKAFRNSGHLKRHGRIHTGETPYHCLVCNNSYKLHKSLKTHLKTHGPRNETDNKAAVKMRIKMKDLITECNICKQRLMCVDNYEDHCALHAKGYWECAACNDVFGDLCSLETHVKKHRNSRYHCPVCEEGFRFASRLYEHANKCHLKIEELIQCIVCKKQFYHHSCLRKHEKLHKKEDNMETYVLESIVKVEDNPLV